MMVTSAICFVSCSTCVEDECSCCCRRGRRRRRGGCRGRSGRRAVWTVVAVLLLLFRRSQRKVSSQPSVAMMTKTKTTMIHAEVKKFVFLWK